MSRRAALLLLAAVALLAASCGGDDSGGPTPAPTAESTSPGETSQPTATASATDPTVTDPALAIETIGGLEQPTQVVFLDDGDMLVAQKTGAIVRVTGGDVKGAVASLKANYSGDRGVLGLALHPDFAENHYVYVFWTWTGDGAAPDGLFGTGTSDQQALPANGNRIDRFTWDGQSLSWDRNIIQLPSAKTDATLFPPLQSKTGGVIAFGPDGKLYAAAGDENLLGQLQNVASGPAPDDSTLAGVVLRLNDDGSAPADNPFASLGDPLDKVYLYGLRNSHGLDFDPKTGAFWLAIDGRATMDTIGRYPAGANAGWLQVMGPATDFSYEMYLGFESDPTRQDDAPEFPLALLGANRSEALANLVAIGEAQYVPPLFAWRFPVTPLALGFVDGAALGPAYDGVLLAGDATTGSVYKFQLSPDRTDLSLEPGLAVQINENSRQDPVGELAAEHIFARNIFAATDIEQAPDGTLWIASQTSGALYHVTAAP